MKESQATKIMDYICENAICYFVGRTCYEAGVEPENFGSIVKALYPEVVEATRDTFKAICEILDIDDIEAGV
jgi:hypothetical protein